MRYDLVKLTIKTHHVNRPAHGDPAQPTPAAPTAAAAKAPRRRRLCRLRRRCLQGLP
jgi:hypothetical protein